MASPCRDPRTSGTKARAAIDFLFAVPGSTESRRAAFLLPSSNQQTPCETLALSDITAAHTTRGNVTWCVDYVIR